MRRNCSKCGTETDDYNDLHCRIILQTETRQLLLRGEIEKARNLVSQAQFDEEWKARMLGLLFFEPAIDQAIKQEWFRREMESKKKLREEEENINTQLAPFFNTAKGLIEIRKFREVEIYVLKTQMDCPHLPMWEIYNSKLRKEIPDEFRIRVNYTHRKDWQRFHDILNREQLPFLIHITDESNLESIREHGGLYSKQAMQEFNIQPNRYASDDLSRSLDNRRGIFDFIHLSIRESPMIFRATLDRGVNPVDLKIDSRFIFAEETKFSDMNATDNNATVGYAIEDFERINFEIANRHRRCQTADEKKLFQAEILVKRHIPLEFITFSP